MLRVLGVPGLPVVLGARGAVLLPSPPLSEDQPPSCMSMESMALQPPAGLWTKVLAVKGIPSDAFWGGCQANTRRKGGGLGIPQDR